MAFSLFIFQELNASVFKGKHVTEWRKLASNLIGEFTFMLLGKASHSRNDGKLACVFNVISD